MIINDLTIENYGPFVGKHIFSFTDRGLALIMGNNLDEPRMQSNGSGKSSLLDALDWVLFGKVPRNDHVDSVINDNCTSCRATLTLCDDQGQTVAVDRYRERGKATHCDLTVGGLEKTALDVKETQRRLEALLGMDREVFKAAVLFSQTNSSHYAEASDTDRIALLTKILQLGEIDTWLERAKSLVSENTQLRTAVSVSIQKVESILSSLDKDFDTAIEQWQHQKADKLKNLETVIQEKRIQLQTLPEVTPRDVLYQQKVAIEKYLAQASPPRASLEMQEAQRAYQDSQTNLAGLVAKRGQLESDIDLWEKKGTGFCSDCGQIITEQYLQAEVFKKKSELSTVIMHVELHTAARDHALEQCQKLDTIQASAVDEFNLAQRRKVAELEQVKSQLAEVSRVEAQQMTITSEITRFEALYANEQAEENPYLKQKTENAQEKVSQEIYLQELDGQRQQLEQEFTYLDFWVKAFGPKGLKSYILDARLNELTEAVNKWVGLLSGGTIWVRFETQKKTRSKKLVNSPNIRVFRWNPDGTTTERNFESWSGGEKQRISFAIDFGLSQLIANRSRNNYNLLILDEVFKHLDQDGKEAVMEMLAALSREKSSVLVVEHDSAFQDSFETRVMIEKKNGQSSIKEMVNGTTENKQADESRRILSRASARGRRPQRTPVLG